MLHKLVRNTILAALTGLVLNLGPAAITWAQSSVDGAISVSVMDPSNALVPSASVTATNIATNSKATATTDETGHYVFVRLAPGVYTLEITASGFATYRQENVIVEVGRTTTLSAKLGIATPSTTVTTTAEAPVVTADRADVATNINTLAMENLPLARRRWSTLALTTPAASPDGTFGLISFRGISGLLNNNTVDGGDNNQAFFSEEKGRTRINYSISQSSIGEFQVNTSNFSAEYGRSAGGVVNAITKSGTNNTTLVVAGDFNPAELKRLVTQYFSDIPSKPAPPPVNCAYKLSPGLAQRVVADSHATLPAVIRVYRIPPAADGDTPALDLLNSILGQGESSRLNVIVVRRDTAAFNASSFSVNERRGPGSLLVLGIANRGVTAARLDSLLSDQIEAIRSGGVTADELTRAKNQYRAGVIQSRETTFGIAEGLNYYNLLFPSVSDMNTDPQRYMAVTAEDIKRVASKYLDPANATVVIVNPAAKAQTGGDQ